MSAFYFLYTLSTTNHLFNHLRQRYTKQQIDLINKVVATRQKISSLITKNKFYNDCIENKVAPNCISFNIKRAKVNQSPVMERAFINDKIDKNKSSLKLCKQNCQKQLANVLQFISDLDYLKLCKYISSTSLKYRNKQITKDSKYIQSLKQKRFGKLIPSNITNIKNLSKHKLTSTETFVLKHGLKFCTPPTKLQRERIFGEVEVLAGQLEHHVPLSKESKQQLYAKLQDFAHSYCGTPIDLSDFHMHKECFQAARDLQNNNSIVMSRPDKGSGVVILDRCDYEAKMLEILSDTTKFQQIGPANDFDHTVRDEGKFQTRLKELLRAKAISKEMCNFVRPSGSQIPKMYGLPKTHKHNTPLRPILSMVGSFHYNLSKFLISILTPVLDKFSKFIIQDSFTFSSFINQIKFNSNSTHMCSFDVKSLFTNVPLTEVLNICLNELYNSDITPPDIPQPVLEELLLKATSGVEFTFNYNIFRQIDGVAMGSPLGPILANIFVGYHESRLLANNTTPLMYRRYVDDIFAIFTSKNEASNFLDELNLLHPALQFTSEDEVDDVLAFLDVLVHRADGSFRTSVFRKPTFTGDYLTWDSFCPVRRKINLIRCLTHRAINICSPIHLDAEIENISTIFLNLGYPENIVKHVIRSKLETRNSVAFGPSKCPAYLRLPYIGNVSNRFEKQLSKAVTNCYGAVSLRVIFGTRTLFAGAGALKDRSPIHHKNNTVYLYKCHCDSAYVGRTGKRLHQRIDQHVPLYMRNTTTTNGVRTSGRRRRRRRRGTINFDNLSAIGQHLLQNPECRRNFREDRFSVLATARSDFHLSVLESIYIQLQRPNLCRQKRFYTTKVFKFR